MRSTPLRTVLVGAGRVGMTYAADPRTGAYFEYASHAQVLSSHPGFSWEAVIDPDPGAREQAASQWGVRCTAARPEDLDAELEADVVVIAAPPGGRRELLERFPSAHCALIEKPPGSSLDDAKQTLKYCRDRGLSAQVNFWRRADRFLRELADGELQKLVGRIQAASALYGGGLRNNGSHLVDLVRMLFGEIQSAQASSTPAERSDPAFTLLTEQGVPVSALPIDFSHYREHSLDIWGTEGRLEISLEGLGYFHSPRRPHRAVSDSYEIATDTRTSFPSTASDALYRMYDNLYLASSGDAEPVSSIESAVQNEFVIEAILDSQRRNGERVVPGG